MKKLIKNLRKIRYSYEETNLSFNKVRRELYKLEIFTDKIDSVEVEWQQLAVGALINLKYWTLEGLGSPSVMGFCTTNNIIYIPEFAVRNDSVLNVLRHEFGHAYANAYPRIFSSMDFKNAFGGKYGNEVVYDTENWKEYCVSEYAASCVQEDFAETFMYYLKHKGNIPVKYKRNRYIQNKWSFISSLKYKILCK